MTAEELANWCFDVGFISKGMIQESSSLFERAMSNKGEQEVEERIKERAQKIHAYSTKLLQMILSDLPDKRLPESKPTKTIDQELEEERKDMIEAINLKQEISKILGSESKKFAEPNDPRFDMHPSIFDGCLYGHDEYRSNTYISVYREAQEKSTSMHEICRQKGLEYDLLIQ